MAFSYAANFLGYGWIPDIITAIAANLAAQIDLPEDLIFLSLAADELHEDLPPADRFVTIRPVDFPPAPGWTGGGRLLTGVQGMFRITHFARYGADQELRSTRTLTEAGRGILVKVKAIIDAMQCFIPKIPNTSDSYLKQPMQFKGFQILPARRGSPWSVIPSMWEGEFNIPLTT